MFREALDATEGAGAFMGGGERNGESVDRVVGGISFQVKIF